MINFTSYPSIESTTLIKWVVPNFDTAFITDYTKSLTLAGDTYTNIGNLLSISDTTSELKASVGDITISLSGIPTGSISTILNQEIKGSSVSIYRAFFNPNTHEPLVIGGSNTFLKFKGIVTNYAITDTVSIDSYLAVSTITLTCNSIVEVLNAKTNGRRTNPADFPVDSSMSRVQALANSNFNFGAP